MWEIRNTAKILFGNLEANKTLGRPKYRWNLYWNLQFRDTVKGELNKFHTQHPSVLVSQEVLRSVVRIFPQHVMKTRKESRKRATDSLLRL
jgi:hypothetical protein